MSALYAGEIPIPEEVVDEILRTGSNKSKSQLRLIYNFMSEQSEEDYTEFVKLTPPDTVILTLACGKFCVV